MHQVKQLLFGITIDAASEFDLFRLYLSLFLINANLVNPQNLILINVGA